MRTRPSSSQLLFALSCSALLVTACGSSDRPSGTKPTNNNSTTNNNTTNNNSTGDCSANPNNCAPNELVGAAPACSCLNVCATGFTWNPSTLVCDPNQTGNDSGTNTNNNTTNNNTTNNNTTNNNTTNNNTTPDGGTMTGQCQTAADCTDMGDVCIDPATADTCSGQADCGCFTPCQPNQAPTGCASGEVCFWNNGGSIPGLCVADQGGQAHGQACQAMFDPAGGLLGDNCATNHYCWGASAQAPTGTCSRLCPPNDSVVCPALGNYACDTSVSQDGSIGLCFEPAPATSDDAAACMSGADCTVSGRCLPEIGGLCGADCSGLKRCGSGSACIPFNAPVNETCVLDCTMGGSSVCAARNANTACHTFGAGTPDAFGLCFPKCVDDMGCLATGVTCNPTTGECS